MKLQYVIKFHGLPHHIPQSVTGRSGKPHGHAVYNQQYRAHVLILPQATWDAHEQDICNGLKRRQAKWSFSAVAIPDEDSNEMKQAEEIDRLKADITRICGERDKATATVTGLVQRIATLEKPAADATAKPEGQPKEEPPVSPIGRQPSEQPPKAVLMSGPVATPPAPEEVAKAIEEMNYRDLRAIAQKANEKAPDTIKLAPYPKQEDLKKMVLALPNLAELLKEAA